MAKNVRASDRSEFFNVEGSGFATRKNTIANPFLHYLTLLVLIVIGVTLIVYYESPEGCAIAVAAGGLIYYFSGQIEKYKKNLFTAEFMNALFSSALGANHRFCLLVTKDGKVAYTNRAFHGLFPEFTEQKDRQLADCLKKAEATPEATAQVMELIAASSAGTVATALKDDGGTAHSMTLLIEPISQPKGFALVRAQ